MSMRFTSYQYENDRPIIEVDAPYSHYDNLARLSVNGDQGYSSRGGYELSIADERFTVSRDTWGYHVDAKRGSVFGADELGALNIAVTATKAGQIVTGVFTVYITPPGGGDHDTHTREYGNMRTSGTAGNDEITFSTYKVLLHAGDGDDTITSTAGRGSYYIFGGRGNDVYDGGDADYGDYLIYGGSGDDYIYGGGGGDYKLRGGSGNDRIFGGEGGDYKLYGGSGNDFIYGGAGNDSKLYGGTGHDLIDGGAGNDRDIYGWTGNDIFVLSGGYDTVMDFKQGEDKVGIREGFSFNFATDVNGNVISTEGGTITLKGFDGTLTAADFVALPTFAEETATTATAPIITFTLSSDSSRIVEADDVVETALTEVILAGGDTTGYAFTTDDTRFAVNNGVLSIVAGSDFDYEAGSRIRVTVTATRAGSDTLDVTYTLSLINIIEGTADGETLYGTRRDDTFDGGAGDDHLHGDEGSDTFVFGHGDGRDIVHGVFEVGSDRLQLVTDEEVNVEYLSFGGLGLMTFKLSETDSITIWAHENTDLKGVIAESSMPITLVRNSADGKKSTVLDDSSGPVTMADFVLSIVPTTISLDSDASKIAEANNLRESALTEVILSGTDTTGYTFTTDDARFAVNNDVLSIVAGSDFDYEAGSVIEVVVTASKANSDTLSTTYTLTLSDVKSEFEAVANKPGGGATGGATGAVDETPSIEYVNGRVAQHMHNIKFTFDMTVEEDNFDVVGIFDEDVAIAEKLEVKKIGTTDDGRDYYDLRVKEGQTYEYNGDADYLNIEYDGEYVGGGAVVIDIH